MVKQFHFDMACDVTDDLEVNQICYSSMNFPRLSIAVFAFPIKCVVSEYGEAQNDPPAAGGRRGGPAAVGLTLAGTGGDAPKITLLIRFVQ